MKICADSWIKEFDQEYKTVDGRKWIQMDIDGMEIAFIGIYRRESAVAVSLFFY